MRRVLREPCVRVCGGLGRGRVCVCVRVWPGGGGGVGGERESVCVFDHG